MAALHLSESPQHLLGRVSATPIGQSNLLALEATADTPGEARAVVDTFASEIIATRSKALHNVLDALIPHVRAQIDAQTPAESAANPALTSELSELQVLRARPDPTISIALPANLPSAPYSPRRTLALLGGLLGGLVLGIGGAFLFDVLDPRLRREEQLRDAFDSRILTRIPRERPRRRTGQPLLPLQLSFAAHEGYRALRTLVAARANGAARAILVTGSAPREGKTTTALGLASALTQGGARVILIEADLRRPVLARALQLELEYGTDDLVGGTATMEEALVSIVSDGNELGVVAVRVASDRIAERLSFEVSEQLVATARASADFVVIDTPPITAVIDALPLTRFVDDVVIVSRIGVSRLAQVADLYALLTNFGTPPLGFVVVGGTPTGGSAYYAGTPVGAHAIAAAPAARPLVDSGS